MKKTALLLLTLTLVFSVQSCKKKEKAKEIGYTIDANKTEINWTAFKTTDKVPVKGKFTKLNIDNAHKESSLQEALNNTTFSIPVSSLFTNNPDRDNKLKTLFFGVMKNTSLLSGTLMITDDNSGYVDLTMNGITEKLPFAYTVNGAVASIKTIMNTDSWQAQAALNSINEACFELHKGADGVSKTWSDVAIDIQVYFK